MAHHDTLQAFEGPTLLRPLSSISRHAVILNLQFYFEFTLLRSLLKEIPLDFASSTILPLILIFCSDSDIDECAGVTCSGRGTCMDGVNMFTCICDTCSTGVLCETSKYSALFKVEHRDQQPLGVFLCLLAGGHQDTLSACRLT